VCHDSVATLRSTGKDSHAAFSCDVCHPGRAFNPHVPPELSVAQLEDASSFKAAAKHSPTAYTSCGMCHDEQVAGWRESVHGTDSTVEGTPSCQGCHGSIHSVTTESQAKRAIAFRCIGCHSFARKGREAPNPHVVDTYRDTIHGKLLALGNDAGAVCANCHGSHAVFAADDPRSTVHEGNRVATCATCHPGATQSFAAAISHRAHTIDEDLWAWITSVGFSLLTVSVIFLLFLHVVLDFLRTGQQALADRRKEPIDTDGPVGGDQQVARFDIHMRLQHWGMMLSFVVLVVTGWPLKAASVGAAGTLARSLGGASLLAVVHRTAGVLLIAVSIYHLAYLLHLWRRNKLSLSMLPSPTDVTDLFDNLLYFFGMRSERPRFGRWTYFEKFDYWAVFWGMVIMGGSGLLLWFPEAASHFVPGEVIAIAHIAHSDEALLALAAIFLWHFYNVHLRPTVFPMSWAWLTGTISAEELYEDHHAEYVRMFGPRAPRLSAAHGHWHQQHRWSYISVAVVLAAGGAVLVGNVAEVRDRIEALEQPVRAPFTVGKEGSTAPGGEERGVYAASFDAFARCFACHNQERYEQGGDGFPHQLHLETIGVDTCTDCHTAAWHESMSTSTELCLTCHDAETIGVREEMPPLAHR
jgi:cytochrome b subunit of formate dehydrogenase